MLDLSVIILAKNEERHIRRCLENILPVAAEVFVIDCFSTDSTVSICREYPRVQVIQHEWPGLYAPQFNWALDPSGPPGFCAWTRTNGSCRKPWRN